MRVTSTHEQRVYRSLAFLSRVWSAAVALSSLTFASTAAQDCPTDKTGRLGFVVERGDLQKTEVFHVDDTVVRTVTRQKGSMILETTEYQGLLPLDRLDRGRKTKFEPQTDLAKLFPLTPGRRITARFIAERDGLSGTLSVELEMKGPELIYIGPCRYSVLKIERSESRTADAPRFIDTDYYSPELKLILVKEYRERNGSTYTVKYDRICPLKQ
jgi:hypothetical protein